MIEIKQLNNYDLWVSVDIVFSYQRDQQNKEIVLNAHWTNESGWALEDEITDDHDLTESEDELLAAQLFDLPSPTIGFK